MMKVNKECLLIVISNETSRNNGREQDTYISYISTITMVIPIHITTSCLIVAEKPTCQPASPVICYGPVISLCMIQSEHGTHRGTQT